MKIIFGVDYGDSRTGLAVSDSLGLLAVGAGCIRCEGFKRAVDAVAQAAIEKKAELIVVGNPVNMNGTEGPRSEKCRAFAEALGEKTSLPVELYDERLTTVSAHRFLSDANVRGKRRKNSVDELSATIILQDFLDRNRDKLNNDQ
ncbi:MAG: Holliday junction resolvase RuvX [Clostridia bacterium]|nr:Holliday junction resolvase RuvX [Clostridia bacterium]MBR6915352.1 Holliday junction resolvase RuvX [Clostridia bacterium]